MTAFYNEFDPYAAQWLRNLIAAGHIAPGVVDERSIEDIKPEELYGYTQCHFFAGIGVWSLALRAAGWPDTRRVWTGSCPCQPFSSAGAGAGFADERHLWPAFHHLIAECEPPSVLGEQVASGYVDPWIDLVHADLEALGYSFGGVPFPAASVGAPHIRDRLYWVAHSRSEQRKQGLQQVPGGLSERAGGYSQLDSPLGHAHHARQQEHRESGNLHLRQREGAYPGRFDLDASVASGGGQPAGPINGFWRNADWLSARDGKWRPVEPGTFPLVNGTSRAVGRVRPDWRTPSGTEAQGHFGAMLKGYGNAINAEAARVFIEAVMECQP